MMDQKPGSTVKSSNDDNKISEKKKEIKKESVNSTADGTTENGGKGIVEENPIIIEEGKRETRVKELAKEYFAQRSKKGKDWLGMFPKQQDESKNFSQFEKKDRYLNRSPEVLQNRIERDQQDWQILNDRHNSLYQEVHDLYLDLNEAESPSKKRKCQDKLNEKKVLKEQIKQELEKLEDKISEDKKELKKKELNDKSSEEVDSNNWSEEVENITAKSLFLDGDPIKKTILYVATFFPGLNPQDFKRVVLLLLTGKSKTIFVKESIITEEGKTQIKETQQEKLLTEIWKESFEQSDGYLKNCYLKVRLKNGAKGINFIIPSLRNDFLTYFEEQQPLYLEEQLQKTQKLHLLLDTSDEVATKAIDIAVKVSIDYPSFYIENWLRELLGKIAQEDKCIIQPLLVRLSALIYRLQIEQDYSRSKDIAQSFLEKLIDSNNLSYAFIIIQELMDKHLRSGSLGIQPAKQLLIWLKELLDKEGSENKDMNLQDHVYILLYELLWQSGLYSYIYYFLEILKEWLPSPDVSSAKYSRSNISVLLLFFVYCDETISMCKHHTELCGKWPSIYPLFTPLKNQDDSYTSNKFDRELNILFSLLFYSTSQKKLALNDLLSNVIPLFGLLYSDDINFLEKIGRFIAEWLVILRGFDDVEPEKEVVNLIEDMARSIIANTSDSLKTELMSFWTSLTDEYLEEATQSKQSGDRKLQKQFTAKRKILRDFKKQFRTLQKEIKAAK